MKARQSQIDREERIITLNLSMVKSS